MNWWIGLRSIEDCKCLGSDNDATGRSLEATKSSFEVNYQILMDLNFHTEADIICLLFIAHNNLSLQLRHNYWSTIGKKIFSSIITAIKLIF